MLEEETGAAVLNDTFFQWGKAKEAEVKPGLKFAHYTSASVAMDILNARDDDRCLWLRNAMLMNDFSEIEYGQSLLRLALKEGVFKNALIDTCNAIHPDIITAFDLLDQEVYAIKRSTYLLSLALHQKDELHQGKLSMWRAYGGEANVCLLLNPEAFMTPQTAYDVVIGAVDYEGPASFIGELARMVKAMQDNRDLLKQIDPQLVKFNFKYGIDVMCLTTKHPGFKEEDEWRLIHRDQIVPVVNAPPNKIVCANGIVQKVFYLPMKNIPEHKVENADLNGLLNRIIIGPTPNPDLVWGGFVRLLTANGVEDAADRVVACNIPLRR